MSAAPHHPSKADEELPLLDFSECHSGILKKLDLLSELPALLEPAARARLIAEQAYDFFRTVIFEHHLDEERELFPAVLESAQAGEELQRVKTMIRRLTDEHRDLENLWKTLEVGLKKLAKGQTAELDGALIGRLVMQYRAHAWFEEQEFLPLSQTILSRNPNHMAALGLSLHMRHQPHAAQNWYV